MGGGKHLANLLRRANLPKIVVSDDATRLQSVECHGAEEQLYHRARLFENTWPELGIQLPAVKRRVRTT